MAVVTGYLDGLGRPIQTVQQDGSSYIVAATFTYDGFGRLRRILANDTTTVLKAYAYTYSRRAERELVNRHS